MDVRVDRASTGTMWTYGLGSIAVGIKNNLLGTYLLLYYNQVLEVNALLVTAALFIALSALNIKKGDKIIMPSINFIASYSVAKFLGAKVYLSDVDRYTGQMRPKDVEYCCKKFG